MQDLRIAAITLTPHHRDVPANALAICDYSRRAADAGAQLAIFPEAFLTAYDLGAISQTARPRDADEVQEIIRVAEDCGIVISFGLLERAVEGTYVTQMYVGRGLREYHRKCHRTDWEKQHCLAGDRLEIQNIGRAKLGTLICYDSAFPAAAEALVRKGAEILIQPSCHGTRASELLPEHRPAEILKRKEHILKYWRARAYDLSCYAIYVNHTGETTRDEWFPGYVCIFSPDGEILAENTQEGEQMVLADLSAAHLEKCRAAKVGHYFTLADARPELYGR